MNKIWEEFKKEAEIDIGSLVPNDNLHLSFWNHKQILKRAVHQKLLQIAQDFFDSLKLAPNIKLKDVTLTGSIASFNWSNYSDIDLHIIIDFSDIDENEDLVREYFGGKIFAWNNKHNIRMNDHEVEIYVQNEKEPHIAAGIFSIMKNEWIMKPKKVEYDIDLKTTKKKVDQFIDQIERIYDLFESRKYPAVMTAAKSLKERIKEMRRAGLSDEGVYSPENMTFKMLRRTGHIKLIYDLINKSYDRIMSLHKDLRGSLKVMVRSLEEETNESFDPVVEEGNFQRRVQQRHYLKKKFLIGHGKQKNTAPYIERPNYKRAKSAAAGFGGS